MDSEGKVFEYFNWARGEGVKWNKVEWFFNNKNVTIRAITEIQPGDEIIFVPNSCMISKEIAVSSEVGIIFTENKHIFENNNEDSQILILVTFLIWEKFKEKNSKRYYYISSQPKTFKLIQDWSEEELKELQDLDLVKMSKQRTVSEMKSYSQWNRVIRNYPQHFSAGMTKYKIFDWAYKLVKTRCFRNPAGELALIPVAELLNHGNNCASYNWYKEESKLNDRLMISPSNNISGLVKDLVAIESLMIDQQPANNNYSIMINTDPNSHVETGKEVFLSYGEYPNRTLLLDYGFSLNENTYDYAIISITTDDISEGLFLESLANKEKYSFIVKKNELCRELIFLLKSFDTHISNFEGERNAINLALNIIHRKLMDFPTLIDEDQKILNHSLNFRNFAAVISKEG